jgi:hypothetical protein
LPGAGKSPALKRIAANARARANLLKAAKVLVCGRRGYAFVDVETPRRA